MRFKLPLTERRRAAYRRYVRYNSDPDFRLHCVNVQRRRRGLPEAQSVDDLRSPPGRRNAPRDEMGRFA